MIGIVHIEDEVFITDRDNAVRIPVERVEIRPTWDIDRAGSKGQVSVTAEAGVLEPGMWLSTYRTITPERGEIIRYPRGHWHLSRPGIAYPGGHEMATGNVAVMQTASGSDIVDDIAGVSMTEAFYTPPGGHVLSDVVVLAKMATAGILGPNLVPNHSFENDLADWGNAFEGGATGSVAFQPSNPATIAVPEGRKVLGPTFNAGAPIGSRFIAYHQNQEIPAGAKYLYFSGLFYGYGYWWTPIVDVRFRDEVSTVIQDVVTPFTPESYSWKRVFMVVPVPDGAFYFRFAIRAETTSAGAPWGRPLWDDIRAGTATMMPLPDDRFNFPPSTAVATTRIQTSAGKSIGYDAINADRLNAIGFNAIATDMDGRLTSQASRTLANATPRYTFGPGDIEIVDDVTPEITAIAEKPYNHWRAVKEDFQDASLSMAADSYNNNPNDPFSVINSGSVHSAPVITVQDAVDGAALQAVADAARDRYSLSETVRFAIMPLQELSVYDVVEIADPEMPELNGLWALNSIDASGDYLVITATRAVSREV